MVIVDVPGWEILTPNSGCPLAPERCMFFPFCGQEVSIIFQICPVLTSYFKTNPVTPIICTIVKPSKDMGNGYNIRC